jgi:bacillithiol synthase
MRFVDTPIAPPAPVPVPDAGGGLDGELLSACCVAPGIEPQLERLAAPDALAVTTGQQPGLLLGPLYTIHKALSAAALAARLEAEWNRPVVPVFWLAGDDHDFAEAHATAWVGADGALHSAALAERPADAPLVPLYRLPLGPSVQEALAALRASFPASPFAEATLEWLGRHYRPEGTVGGAFAGALAELLAPHGVVCFDSTHPAAKRAMLPGLLAALEDAGPLDRALAERALELAREGSSPAVATGDGATLVFLEGEQGRDRLVLDGEALVARRSGTRYTLAQVRAIGEREPHRLSPNVLLRPAIERLLLPTAAYVAGPGELAYLPQALPVYRRLGLTPQTPVARWSGIVVEPRVDRVLSRYDARLEELLAPDKSLERRVVRDRLPAAVVEAVARLRRAITEEYATLEEAALGIDPTLKRPVGAARHQADTGLAEVERRLERHLRRREETELAQIARARTAVLPGDRPQERVVTVAGLLARYGPSVLDGLAERIRDWYAGALVAGSPTP